MLKRKLPYIAGLLMAASMLCLPGVLQAQLSPSLYSYPNDRLPWFTIESNHFKVHFQLGNNKSAQRTAQIAEQIYGGITSLYNYEPDDKTNIVLKDRQDYSNGASYFFDNQIDIWVPALDTPLRGTHRWLWDVVTHEFTHIVQLESAMKKNRHIPAVYFQWLSYANVRRPDVLYGYPKGIITYPFASISVPAWFAEGVAQYQRSKYFYDFWDAQRDMLLRTAIISDRPLGFEEMGIFSSKTSLERERIYNQGFAFISFLVDRFGEYVLADISSAMSKPGIFDVDKAIKKATGTSGKELFTRFVDQSNAYYTKAIASITFDTTQTVEAGGKLNFYPKVSHRGNKLAYLSNKNSHSLQLYITQLDDSAKKTARLDLGKPNRTDSYPGAFKDQDPIIKHIQSSYSFSPDGQKIIFSKQKLNKFGESYNDLFVYDLKSENIKRLTQSRRISSPLWYSKKSKAIAIQQTGPGTNLVEVDIKTSEVKQLTSYSSGQQVYTPARGPKEKTVIFALSDATHRKICSYNMKSGKVKTLLQDSLASYRDPYFDAQNNDLYFSANPDGIFNIYRLPMNRLSQKPQKMTNVLGGAFMPDVYKGTLYFSEFKMGGFDISSTNLSKHNIASDTGAYHLSSDSFFKLLKNDSPKKLPQTLDLTKISKARLNDMPDSASLSLSYNHQEKPDHLYPYKSTYTDFSFYPVVRFDNYSKKNGSNGKLLTAAHFGDLGKNLLRDMKIGTYFSSREVTGKLTFFGSALLGIASEPANGIGNFFSPARLTDLDRDLSLITEYRGLPFIKKRWSPTVSVELYNIRRNVADGLSIEEFPCTSCLPDTTNTDIAYNVWEADLYLRSKINASNLVELGAGYSPYKIQTDGFFSRELKQRVPSSSSEYYRSARFTAAYVYEQFLPYPNQDVAPLGLRSMLRYTYEPGKLLDNYTVKDGSLSPVYKTSKNHSLELTLRYGHRITPNSSINFYARGFSYLNEPNNSFYLDYIGGFTGMRSYPYFALGGNSTAFTQLSYTFPIVRNLNKQIGRHTLDKLYLRLFGEAGNAWHSTQNSGNNIKTGAGAELRFAFNSYYLFPLKLFISGAYGFNKFDVTLDDEFISDSKSGTVTYGHDFIFHFGLTFDFDILNHE